MPRTLILTPEFPEFAPYRAAAARHAASIGDRVILPSAGPAGIAETIGALHDRRTFEREADAVAAYIDIGTTVLMAAVEEAAGKIGVLVSRRKIPPEDWRAVIREMSSASPRA